MKSYAQPATSTCKCINKKKGGSSVDKLLAEDGQLVAKDPVFPVVAKEK